MAAVFRAWASRLPSTKRQQAGSSTNPSLACPCRSSGLPAMVRMRWCIKTCGYTSAMFRLAKRWPGRSRSWRSLFKPAREGQKQKRAS